MTSPPQTNRKPVLGCIADDVTGATDLAINLVNGGMRVVQALGVPNDRVLENASQFDAIVIALKTRSIAAEDAIAQSLHALASLRRLGIERFYFKYCSTFDSTPQGNIGPVAEALMRELEVDQTVFCPAFPRAGRTVYRGHLFVGDQLLSESGMENHPLNPMADANLVRFLSQQAIGKVGLLAYQDVVQGTDAISGRLKRLAAEGVSNVIVDACDDSHLAILAAAAVSMRLVTGGSGLARFLPRAYRSAGIGETIEGGPELPTASGRSLIIAGSCSQATKAQVGFLKDRCPFWQVDVRAVVADEVGELARVKAWAVANDPSQPILIASTAPADEVEALQREFGVQEVASAIEHFLGNVAHELTSDLGVRRLVLAGGETSGAVVSQLGIQALRIGPEICAGVPWTESIGTEPTYALALKSGNFGAEDFFAKALEMLA